MKNMPYIAVFMLKFISTKILLYIMKRSVK